MALQERYLAGSVDKPVGGDVVYSGSDTGVIDDELVVVVAEVAKLPNAPVVGVPAVMAGDRQVGVKLCVVVPLVVVAGFLVY